jgi:hypothetical protein
MMALIIVNIILIIYNSHLMDYITKTWNTLQKPVYVSDDTMKAVKYENFKKEKFKKEKLQAQDFNSNFSEDVSSDEYKAIEDNIMIGLGYGTDYVMSQVGRGVKYEDEIFANSVEAY